MNCLFRSNCLFIFLARCAGGKYKQSAMEKNFGNGKSDRSTYWVTFINQSSSSCNYETSEPFDRQVCKTKYLVTNMLQNSTKVGTEMSKVDVRNSLQTMINLLLRQLWEFWLDDTVQRKVINVLYFQATNCHTSKWMWQTSLPFVFTKSILTLIYRRSARLSLREARPQTSSSLVLYRIHQVIHRYLLAIRATW